MCSLAVKGGGVWGGQWTGAGGSRDSGRMPLVGLWERPVGWCHQWGNHSVKKKKWIRISEVSVCVGGGVAWALPEPNRERQQQGSVGGLRCRGRDLCVHASSQTHVS
jgi:hypothetical protein